MSAIGSYGEARHQQPPWMARRRYAAALSNLIGKDSDMMTWQEAAVVTVDGAPTRANGGAAVKVGDMLDKAEIDGLTGGRVELDRPVAHSFRFPVAVGAKAYRARLDFAPKPPEGSARVATSPAVAVEVSDAPTRKERRR